MHWKDITNIKCSWNCDHRGVYTETFNSVHDVSKYLTAAWNSGASIIDIEYDPLISTSCDEVLSFINNILAKVVLVGNNHIRKVIDNELEVIVDDKHIIINIAKHNNEELLVINHKISQNHATFTNTLMHYYKGMHSVKQCPKDNQSIVDVDVNIECKYTRFHSINLEESVNVEFNCCDCQPTTVYRKITEIFKKWLPSLVTNSKKTNNPKLCLGVDDLGTIHGIPMNDYMLHYLAKDIDKHCSHFVFPFLPSQCIKLYRHSVILNHNPNNAHYHKFNKKTDSKDSFYLKKQNQEVEEDNDIMKVEICNTNECKVPLFDDSNYEPAALYVVVLEVIIDKLIYSAYLPFKNSMAFKLKEQDVVEMNAIDIWFRWRPHHLLEDYNNSIYNKIIYDQLKNPFRSHRNYLPALKTLILFNADEDEENNGRLREIITKDTSALIFGRNGYKILKLAKWLYKEQIPVVDIRNLDDNFDSSSGLTTQAITIKPMLSKNYNVSSDDQDYFLKPCSDYSIMSRLAFKRSLQHNIINLVYSIANNSITGSCIEIIPETTCCGLSFLISSLYKELYDEFDVRIYCKDTNLDELIKEAKTSRRKIVLFVDKPYLVMNRGHLYDIIIIGRVSPAHHKYYLSPYLDEKEINEFSKLLKKVFTDYTKHIDNICEIMKQGNAQSCIFRFLLELRLNIKDGTHLSDCINSIVNKEQNNLYFIFMCFCRAFLTSDQYSRQYDKQIVLDKMEKRMFDCDVKGNIYIWHELIAREILTRYVKSKDDIVTIIVTIIKKCMENFFTADWNNFVTSLAKPTHGDKYSKFIQFCLEKIEYADTDFILQQLYNSIYLQQDSWFLHERANDIAKKIRIQIKIQRSKLHFDVYSSNSGRNRHSYTEAKTLAEEAYDESKNTNIEKLAERHYRYYLLFSKKDKEARQGLNHLLELKKNETAGNCDLIDKQIISAEKFRLDNKMKSLDEINGGNLQLPKGSEFEQKYYNERSVDDNNPFSVFSS